MKKNNDAWKAMAAHTANIRQLIRAIQVANEAQIVNANDPSWSDVGSFSAAHDALVNAAYHLGAITAEEAKTKHGVAI